MSKMIQMKESTAKREVKQEYGLTETDGQAFWDRVNRVIGEPERKSIMKTAFLPDMKYIDNVNAYMLVGHWLTPVSDICHETLVTTKRPVLLASFLDRSTAQAEITPVSNTG